MGLNQQILHKIRKLCMTFGHLILRKITKFVATTGCQILLRLKCTKFNCGRGFYERGWKGVRNGRELFRLELLFILLFVFVVYLHVFGRQH